MLVGITDAGTMKEIFLYLFVVFCSVASSYESCDTFVLLKNGTATTNGTVSVGDSIVFQCTCNDEWTQNEMDIIADIRHIINATTGSLTLLAIRYSDRGDYACNATSNSIFTLTVKGNVIFSIDYVKHLIL